MRKRTFACQTLHLAIITTHPSPEPEAPTLHLEPPTAHLQDELRELGVTVGFIDTHVKKVVTVCPASPHNTSVVSLLDQHLKNAFDLVKKAVRHEEETGLHRLKKWCFALARASQFKQQLIQANDQLKKRREDLRDMVGAETLVETKHISEQVQAVLEVQSACTRLSGEAQLEEVQPAGRSLPRANKCIEQADSRAENGGGGSSDPWVIDDSQLEYEPEPEGDQLLGRVRPFPLPSEPAPFTSFPPRETGKAAQLVGSGAPDPAAEESKGGESCTSRLNCELS